MTCEGVEGDSGDMKGSSKRSAALGYVEPWREGVLGERSRDGPDELLPGIDSLKRGGDV
jgi:hypothetical protein